MAVLNYSLPYLAATPTPPTPAYYNPPPHLNPLLTHSGPYSYPPPEKPFLNEDFSRNPLQSHHTLPHQPPGHLGGAPLQPTFTQVTDDGTRTNVHAVIDYDYDEGDEDGAQSPPVTPIQGPIYLKNGTVPVVPLYSHPVLNNGTFVQIPVSSGTLRSAFISL